MNTASLYRSLTIHERKQAKYQSTTKQKIDDAHGFWKSLLKTENFSTNVEDLLRENYQITLNFLESTLQLDENQSFEHEDQWFLYIKLLFQHEVQYEGDSDFDEMEATLKDFPFYSFFLPFLKELYFDFIKTSPFNSILSISAKNDIIKKFLDTIYYIAYKTLILEINALRISNVLQGDTPEQRYEHYCRMLKDDTSYRIGLVEEYPVLFRLIATKINYFKTFLLELLTNYANDKPLLQKKLNLNPDEKIKHLHLGSGDSHKKGKTVTIVELENGQKVVYKPRSLGIDIAFQKLIHWFNDKNDSNIHLKTIETINKELYGWAEFVTHDFCQNLNEVQHFYHRIGQLLGILHVMNATDFHFENIISHGEHPVLIDLESLFHHTISPDHKMTESEAINKALQLINDSVLSTGVIPHRTLIVEGKSNFDLSGIGNTQTEQTLPIRMGVVSNLYTDEVKIMQSEGIISAGANNPKLDGVNLNIGDFVSEIESGFSLIYNIIKQNKSEFKRQLSLFKGNEVRKLFRDTMKYAKLLELSYHPDFLRNQIDREILLNRLRLQKDNRIQKAMEYEMYDLLQGDIPYFTSTPESNHIYSSDNIRIENFYYKDGMSLSLTKVDRLNEEDLANQLNIIRTTISAVYSSKDAQLLEMTYYSDEVTQDALIKKATELGDILLKHAIKYESQDGEKEFAWISMVTQGGNEETWTYSVTGPGLYDGNCGIAYYFAYLWKLTGEDRFKEAAYASLLPIRKLFAQLTGPKGVNLGGFLGIGGIIYTLHHISRIFEDEEIKKLTFECVHAVEKYINQDRVYDIIGGSAGALVVLLNVYEDYKEECILSLARKLVEHLVSNAKAQEIGVAWVQGTGQKSPYIGFSHGNAGIIYALARYLNFDYSEELAEIIRKAINYENTFFSSEHGNWFSNHLNDYSIAWCHGAPGILLSRSYLKDIQFDHDEIDRDYIDALDTSLTSGYGKNYSLCHGDLGLLDILHLTKKHLSDTKQEQVEEVQSKILLDVLSTKQLQADINVVGLMSGIGSIGYGLLRAAYPDEVPSLLILEKPKLQLN